MHRFYTAFPAQPFACGPALLLPLLPTILSQVIRTPLEAAVKEYNPKKEVVVLVRARCGYMAVAVVPLVPEYAVCRQLSTDYVDKDALQLNLDDTG